MFKNTINHYKSQIHRKKNLFYKIYCKNYIKKIKKKRILKYF